MYNFRGKELHRKYHEYFIHCAFWNSLIMCSQSNTHTLRREKLLPQKHCPKSKTWNDSLRIAHLFCILDFYKVFILRILFINQKPHRLKPCHIKRYYFTTFNFYFYFITSSFRIQWLSESHAYFHIATRNIPIIKSNQFLYLKILNHNCTLYTRECGTMYKWALIKRILKNILFVNPHI